MTKIRLDIGYPLPKELSLELDKILSVKKVRSKKRKMGKSGRNRQPMELSESTRLALMELPSIAGDVFKGVGITDVVTIAVNQHAIEFVNLKGYKTRKGSKNSQEIVYVFDNVENIRLVELNGKVAQDAYNKSVWNKQCRDEKRQFEWMICDKIEQKTRSVILADVAIGDVGTIALKSGARPCKVIDATGKMVKVKYDDNDEVRRFNVRKKTKYCRLLSYTSSGMFDFWTVTTEQATLMVRSEYEVVAKSLQQRWLEIAETGKSNIEAFQYEN